MKVFLGADHRGFELKNLLIEYINSKGYEAVDMGNTQYDKNDDYPDFAIAVSKAVLKESGSLGIVICGSGGGISIAANKHNGIRCIIGFDSQQAKATKEDEDTNVLGLSSDFTSEEKAKEIVSAWLEAKFSGEERHVRRLDKIKQIEKLN